MIYEKRMRWLWYEWTHESKPWVGTKVPRDAMDRLPQRYILEMVKRVSSRHNTWLEGGGSEESSA